MVRLFAVVLTVLAASCSVGNDIGAESLGVWVDNSCARPIQAEAAHTADLAGERLQSSPIEIPPGEGRKISVISNAAAHPSAYFLAIRVGRSEPLIMEFDIDRLESELVRATFGSDCASLVEG